MDSMEFDGIPWNSIESIEVQFTGTPWSSIESMECDRNRMGSRSMQRSDYESFVFPMGDRLDFLHRMMS